MIDSDIIENFITKQYIIYQRHLKRNKRKLYKLMSLHDILLRKDNKLIN